MPSLISPVNIVFSLKHHSFSAEALRHSPLKYYIFRWSITRLYAEALRHFPLKHYIFRWRNAILTLKKRHVCGRTPSFRFRNIYSPEDMPSLISHVNIVFSLKHHSFSAEALRHFPLKYYIFRWSITRLYAEALRHFPLKHYIFRWRNAILTLKKRHPSAKTPSAFPRLLKLC